MARKTAAKRLTEAVPPSKAKNKSAATPAKKSPAKVKFLGSKTSLVTAPATETLDTKAGAMVVELGLHTGQNGVWNPYNDMEYRGLFSSGDEYGRTQWRNVTEEDELLLSLGAQIGDQLGTQYKVTLRRKPGKTERATSTPKGKSGSNSDLVGALQRNETKALTTEDRAVLLVAGVPYADIKNHQGK